MGENRAARCMDGLHHGLGSRLTDDGITTAIDPQRWVIDSKPSASTCANSPSRNGFNTSPERGDDAALLSLFDQPMLHRGDRPRAVVVGDCKVMQAPFTGLTDQIEGFKAAIAANGVTVEIESVGTCFRPTALEDRPQGMGSHHLRTARLLQPEDDASGHKTESTQP